MHFPQFPPQSMPVSVPLLRPSEQLMHVCAARSHVGFVPVVQSLFFVQLKHEPTPSHMPFGHIVPLFTGTFVGTPPMQIIVVQTFKSSRGVSFGSISIAGLPSDPHTLFMQSFGVWVVDGSPVVSFGVQIEATQVETVQPSWVAVPQSTSAMHGVQPAPVPQLPELASVVAVVALVELAPPAEAPARLSVQPLGARTATLASTTIVPATSARDPRAHR